MDDKRMNGMPEEDGLRPEPLTLREKFILGALIAVTALWTILLCRGVEWASVWIRSIIK